MTKIYLKQQINTSQSSIRLTVKGKSKGIIFESKRKDGRLTYETADKDIQEAIENSNQYESGQVECISGATTKKAPVPVETLPVIEPEVFEEVSTYQQAKDLLKGEPYQVPFQALNTPANILKKAAELGVSFPNLKAE